MNTSEMDHLLHGIVAFRQNMTDEQKELFSDLKCQQKPHTLFLTCSDSRIDPNRVTNTLPGELFIIRNIANIVPPYRDSSEYLSTTSAVEYAVLMLGVKNIIVCGHSNCGGCFASLQPAELLDRLPHTQKWLELMAPVRDFIDCQDTESPILKEVMMEQANVLYQIQHLLTFPYVKEKVDQGQLQLAAWYYVIESGEVFVYNEKSDEFELRNALT